MADITIYEKEDAVLTFTMAPVVNITGWTISFTVATDVTSSTALLTKTGAVTNGPSGIFTVTLTSTDTGTTLAGDTTYNWCVRRTDSGNVTLLALGQLKIKSLPGV